MGRHNEHCLHFKKICFKVVIRDFADGYPKHLKHLTSFFVWNFLFFYLARKACSSRAKWGQARPSKAKWGQVRGSEGQVRQREAKRGKAMPRKNLGEARSCKARVGKAKWGKARRREEKWCIVQWWEAMLKKAKQCLGNQAMAGLMEIVNYWGCKHSGFGQAKE